MKLLKNRHNTIFWMLVILVLFSLGYRQMVYIGISNVANVFISQGMLSTINEPKRAQIGIQLMNTLDKLKIPIGAELLRLRGIAELTISQKSVGEEDLIRASILGNSLADYYLAEWYADQGDWAKAAAQFHRTQPEDSHVLNRYIDRLIRANRYDDAIALASKYVAIHPNSPDTYYRLANLYWSRGNREGTITALNEALSYDQDIDSYNYRYQSARLAYLQQDHATAAQVILSLLEENPGDFASLYLAGLVFSALKDYPKAQGFLISALEQNPNHHFAHLALASVFQNQNNLSQAADEYQQASILASDPSASLRRLAEVYRQMDDTCRERAILSMVDRRRPGEVNLDTEFMNIDQQCSP